MQQIDWYQLALDTGDIDQKIRRIHMIFTNKYGLTHKITKICWHLDYYKVKLQSDLDNQLYKMHPNTDYLPYGLFHRPDFDINMHYVICILFG